MYFRDVSLHMQVLFAVGGVSNALCMVWELITDANVYTVRYTGWINIEDA